MEINLIEELRKVDFYIDTVEIFTRSEKRKLLNIKDTLVEIDKRIEKALDRTISTQEIDRKIASDYLSSTKALTIERMKYELEGDQIIIFAELRDFEMRFCQDQEKILDDAKAEVQKMVQLPVDEVLSKKEISAKINGFDNQKLFNLYVKRLDINSVRIHRNYCWSNGLEECNQKISEYIMTEARKRFKTDYGIDPNCDFSILKYNKYFADFRKPNERMLDPMKLEDSTVSYELENMTLQFEKHKKLNNSGKKILIYLLYNFTNSDLFHERSLKFALSDYMALCDLKSKNNAIKQIRSGLENLFSLSVTLKGKEKNQGSFRFRRLIADAGLNINNGYINIEITSLFLELTKTSRVLILPQQYFRINLLHFPNSPDILMKASEQKSMNHKSSNNDILTIRTLLEACSGLPKYEDIKSQGRINQRIKEPFFRDLDHLSETFTYELYTTDKVKITVEEAKALPFEEFENIRVHIKWNDFPERKISPSQKN